MSSIKSPSSSSCLVHLSERSEELTKARSTLLGKSAEILAQKLTNRPKHEALLMFTYFELATKLFQGKLLGCRISDIPGIDTAALVKSVLLYEKNLTYQLIQNNYSSLVQIGFSKLLRASEKTQNIFSDFEKMYCNESKDDIDFKCFDNHFYIDAEYILNSESFNSEISQKSIDCFKLETGTKRSAFLHNLFKPLIIDENSERFVHKYIPEKLSKCAIFLAFLESSNLVLIDVKLKSIEDSRFENQIKEDFKNYTESFPFLQTAKKTAQIAQVDKMAFSLEALKDELEAEIASRASPKVKKSPQKNTSPQAPLKPSVSINHAPDAASRSKDILTTVKTISKQQALSLDWKKVEIIRRSTEVSPSKIFKKIVNYSMPLNLKMRILRWTTLQSLEQVKQFEDIQSQDSRRKSVKRYETLTDQELFIQVLRHYVPSSLLAVLASPDFRQLYCYQKDDCYYIKARIFMPSIDFREETIVSFAFNHQNQLYHFFVHPKQEIQFDKELSDIPIASDLAAEEILAEAMLDDSSQELTSVVLDNLNVLGITAKYNHPVDKNPLQLLIIPRN